jgi:hypothetical protein
MSSSRGKPSRFATELGYCVGQSPVSGYQRYTALQGSRPNDHIVVEASGLRAKGSELLRDLTTQCSGHAIIYNGEPGSTEALLCSLASNG